MAVFWQERVRAAELARFEASFVGRLLAGLGISTMWFRRVQDASWLLSWVAWAVVLRKVKLILGTFALLAILIVALLVIAIAQLA